MTVPGTPEALKQLREMRVDGNVAVLHLQNDNVLAAGANATINVFDIKQCVARKPSC